MTKASELGMPRFHNPQPLEMIERELIPYVKQYLTKQGQSHPPFLLFQQPGGGSWARVPCSDQWMNDRTRMYASVQELTSAVPIPAVVFSSNGYTFIPKDSRRNDPAFLDQSIGLEEMERRGLGRRQDSLLISCETAEGAIGHWMLPYSLNPVRFHNERILQTPEFNFTGRAHFYKLTKDADKGIPPQMRRAQ
jgi:hypothetical protein